MSSNDKENQKRICGAINRAGNPCRLKPLFKTGTRGNGRCKHHGGLSTGPVTPEGKARTAQNALKHGLYSQRLRNSFKSEADRQLFDEVERNTDLSEEIALTRVKIAHFQEMIEKGTWVREVGLSPHDLLTSAKDLLRRLAQAQQEMHPGAGMKGNLRIKVTVSNGKEHSEDDALVPDLVDGGSNDSNPLEGPPEDTEPEESPGKLDDFDRDE